jgi:hypothetical protein
MAPGGNSYRLPLEETKPGHYEARITTADAGLYRIASGNADLHLPEIGFYQESAETRVQAAHLSLLSEISRLTGGRIRPSIDEVLNRNGGVVRELQPLWQYLLGVALALNLIEVAPIAMASGIGTALTRFGATSTLLTMPDEQTSHSMCLC